MARPRALPALLALAFAAFYAATTRGVFVFGDDLLVYQVTESIAERREVSVSSPAPAGDVAFGVPGPDGRRYAKYAPGLSIAAVPFYLGGRALERAGFVLPATRDAWGNERTGTRVLAAGLTNALVGGLAVGVAAWTLLELGFGVAASALTALLVGLATPLAHSSTTFLSEPLAALGFLGAAGATAALARWAREARDAGGLADDRELAGGRGPRLALAAGAFASLAISAKLAHVVALAGLALATAWALGGRSADRRLLARGLAAWALPVGLTLLALAAYNQVRFGSPWQSGYAEEATRFTRPWLEGLAGLTISPAKGAVWYAPPILLGVAGLAALWRRHRATALVCATVPTALLLLYSKYYQWHGGGSWGPRLLVPALPLLVLPAAELLVRRPLARATSAAIALAAAAGILVSALAVLVPFERPAASPPLPAEPDALVATFWRPGESPIVRAAAAAPAALARTLRLLVGREPLPGPDGKDAPDLPNLAFARYGSHALLELTRGALGLALLLGAAIAYGVARGRERSTAPASQ